ncbi:hypothetical protein GGR53DRAFT_529722 [Hypoxylon sp. FL1150]|nr:hypothetical protein GGR53DRAFT_529722 [Hypoxylon sp. FL1150]
MSAPPPPSKPQQHPQLFTCTFCWHLSRGPPHACGEVVFRGDDCVSLGWCFWHRACYGCLLCGSRLVVAGPKLAELFDDNDDGDRVAASTSARGNREEGVVGLGLGPGKEIAEIPTCANCVVRSGVDSGNQQNVVQNVLRRVDRIDGGMARQRWERGNGQVSRQAVGEIKRVPSRRNSAAIQAPTPPNRAPWLSQVRARTSHTSRLAGDGAMSGSDDESKGCVVPLDSTIYVSIHDPINEPAFKPSPTKPIPKWMQWLPSQRNRRHQNEVQPRSILDEHFPPRPGPSSKTELPSEPKTVCPTTPPGVKHRPAHSQLPDYLSVPTAAGPNDAVDSTIKALKGPSFVLDEPLKRPSSRVAASAPSSSSPTRAAKAEPTLPPPPRPSLPLPESLSPGSRSPFAPRNPSPLGGHEEKAESSESKDASWNVRLRRPSSPLTEQVVAHFQRYIRRTPPAQSREFLNLYKPAAERTRAGPGPSVAVSGREGDRVVGGGGTQVRSRLGRDREHSPTPGFSGGGDGQVVTDGGDVVDLRSMRKRSSLQAELKKLLGGRGQGKERDRERERERERG